MNKRITVAVMLLTIIVFMPITTSADFPTGELGYSDEIIPGAEFVWTVSKLVLTGDFAFYTEAIYIGDVDLNQGDKIKVKILEDPDNATDIWYDIYVNGVKISDPDVGFLILLNLYYSYGNFFINPVTYTNSSGTYNIYEQIMEELEDEYYDYSYGYSETYSDYTVEYVYSSHFEFQLQGDVLSFSRYEYYAVNIAGSGYDDSLHRELRMDSTLNIRTGLLGKSELYADFDMYDMTGVFHVLIDSSYASPNDGKTIVPYSWGFSVLGLALIASVVALVKRKRK